MDLQNLVVIVFGMAGFGVFVSAIVGALKTFGAIDDGDSQNWVTGLNLLGVIAIFVLKVTGLQVDLSAIDKDFELIAKLVTAAGELLIAMGGSKWFYEKVKGTKIIGKSFSVK